MTSKTKELSALEIKRLTKTPGTHNVGVTGLYLNVYESGASSWLLRLTIGGKRKEIGLGSYPTVSLAEAREYAKEKRKMVEAGVDPVLEKKRNKDKLKGQHEIPTFAECAKDFIEINSPNWKNPKHVKQWTATMRDIAGPVIGNLPVNMIDDEHIYKVLKDIWKKKPETGTRVRGRMEKILDWAMAQDYIASKVNPAVYVGKLKSLLPSVPKSKRVVHHPGMSYTKIPDFMAQLKEIDNSAARAMEFLILTNARTNEVCSAEWSHVDLENAVWTVPPELMKNGKEHRVALSTHAIDLLKSLPEQKSKVLFVPRFSTYLHENAMLNLLRKMGVPPSEGNVHGFRNTFGYWAEEVSEADIEVANRMLSHTQKDSVKAAYFRSDLLNRRRVLGQAWGDYCYSKLK